MIAFIPYVLFLSIFFLGYFSIKLGLLPHKVIWLPELLSGITLILITFRSRCFAIKSKYMIFFILFLLHISLGIIINTVPSGAIFSGIRTYLKFIPFFLLPAVVDFSDSDIKKYLIFLLALGLIQFPLSLYQRLIQFKGVLTGDVVTGTLATSSVLSIYLICSMAILFSFYLQKRIRMLLFLSIFFLLFIPTTLNETKGTLILLPIALFVPVLFCQTSKARIKRVVSIFVVCLLLFSIFVPIYDYFMTPRTGNSIIDFVTSKWLVRHYLYTGDEISPTYMGRVDHILAPICELSDDPIKLMGGLGIGNVSISRLKEFSGEYIQYARLGSNEIALSYILWELGVNGVILYLWFFYLVFMDARYLSARDDIWGSLALGWIAVVAIFIISLPYKNFLMMNELSYSFWFFSGCIAAKRCRLGHLP